MYDETFLKELVETSPEIAVYLSIQGIGSFCFYMSHDMADGRIPEERWEAIDKDILKAREDQVVIVKSLTSFGLSKPLDDENKPTSDYWKWYKWWNIYVESLSDDDFKKMDASLTKKEEVSIWRPKGNWKE
jgi:hypothetical protein